MQVWSTYENNVTKITQVVYRLTVLKYFPVFLRKHLLGRSGESFKKITEQILSGTFWAAAYSRVCACFIMEVTISKYMKCSNVVLRTLSNIFKAAFCENRVNKSETVARRSSTKKVFLKVLQDSQSLFFKILQCQSPSNKVASLQVWGESPTQLFSCEFREIFLKNFLQSTSGWLLLLNSVFM